MKISKLEVKNKIAIMGDKDEPITGRKLYV